MGRAKQRMIEANDISAIYAAEFISLALSSVFLLEPVPAMMRGYTFKADELKGDGSNIAGVIQGLPQHQRDIITEVLTKYANRLPENEVIRVFTEPVGPIQKDAMLYCIEKWGNREVMVDARGMSDGTLRFLAILTALLTLPAGSCIIIEEIDNGLHSSRARNLIEMIKSIQQERDLDVIITTHNPALLNEFVPEYIPFVTIAHRDRAKGSSQLTLLEEVPNLTRLLSKGKLGDISMDGTLEKALQRMRVEK